MMSARDVAVAALGDVIVNKPSESHESEELGEGATINVAATNIEVDIAKNTCANHPRETNASTTLQSNSSTNSQETTATPPTSEGLSSLSQESQSQFSQLSQLTNTTASLSQDVETGPPVLSIATNAGQKRTHDGYTKHPDSGSSASPPIESFGGHSRNTSTISTASSAVSSRELVSDLRTRLSYAMTKVNKGWESLPLEEVESLTSQTGSPSSSSSTINGRRNVFPSPRTTNAGAQDPPRDGSQYGSMTAVSSSQRDPILFSDGQPSSRTYESFWREQSQRHTGTPSTLTSPASSQPALAPPADITYTARQNSRRSETPKFSKSPMLTGPTASDLSQNSQLSGTSNPHTPNRNSQVVDAILQTPSQKSIQEREAIETLMFMGSPSNPNLPHPFSPQASQQPSPLRAEFGTQIRGTQDRSGFPMVPSNGIVHPGTRRGRYATRPLSGEDLDRMLDMPDDSSDDEIEIPITPRRLAAGRV